MIGTGFRYLAVAISSALLHNVIMIGGDLVGIHYLPATFVSYVAVVLWGFALHSWFTFRRPLSLRSLPSYAAGMAMNLPGSLVLMFAFCDLAGLPVAIAAPATTLLLFAWNFAMSRWAIVGRLSLQKAD